MEEVPRLVRGGMATHGIKGSVPKEQYDHFLLVYNGEKELKQAAGFDQPDDAYLLAIDSAGAIEVALLHGAVTDAALDQDPGRLSSKDVGRIISCHRRRVRHRHRSSGLRRRRSYGRHRLRRSYGRRRLRRSATRAATSPPKLRAPPP